MFRLTQRNDSNFSPIWAISAPIVHCLTATGILLTTLLASNSIVFAATPSYNNATALKQSSEHPIQKPSHSQVVPDAEVVVTDPPITVISAKGKCIFPKFTYYPSTTPVGGRLRYGQADIRFEICPGKDPTDWKSSISVWHNTTASAQGYDFIKEEIHPTSGGDYYRFYEATFKWQDCMPFYAWPCSVRGTFKIKFYAWVVQGKPGVIYQSASAPTYWTLYDKP